MFNIRAVDAHVGGQVLRLITDGAPRTPGKTIAQKQSWLLRHGDSFRRAVVLEPRGHADLTAAMLVESSLPGAHAGILFMDADGQPALSGHGIIAATTIAVERGLLFSRDDRDAELEVTFETVAGLVQARARVDERGDRRRVDSVAFTTVPAFVVAPAHPVKLGSRELRVDIAFGGVFCAIVDTEAVGIPLEVSRVPDLRRFGRDLLQALNSAIDIVHPLDAAQSGVTAVIFTGPARDPEAHLRNVTVTRGGAVDRSAGGVGTAAVMAVLDAMGFLPEGQPFVHEGLLGGLLRGTPVRHVPVNDYPGLVTTIEGTAWITGEHTLLFDDDDPFRDGFRL
jgi:proline racemase